MKLFKFKRNHTRVNDILRHLSKCDYDFNPNLSSYVDLDLYSKKLCGKAERFEIWSNNNLVGLLAVYSNKKDNLLFISNLSLDKEIRGQNMGNKLIDLMLNEYKVNSNFFKRIRLEVKKDNTSAIKFYKKNGFKFSRQGFDNVMIYEREI